MPATAVMAAVEGGAPGSRPGDAAAEAPPALAARADVAAPGATRLVGGGGGVRRRWAHRRGGRRLAVAAAAVVAPLAAASLAAVAFVALGSAEAGVAAPSPPGWMSDVPNPALGVALAAEAVALAALLARRPRRTSVAEAAPGSGPGADEAATGQAEDGRAGVTDESAAGAAACEAAARGDVRAGAAGDARPADGGEVEGSPSLDELIEAIGQLLVRLRVESGARYGSRTWVEEVLPAVGPAPQDPLLARDLLAVSALAAGGLCPDVRDLLAAHTVDELTATAGSLFEALTALSRRLLAGGGPGELPEFTQVNWVR